MKFRRGLIPLLFALAACFLSACGGETATPVPDRSTKIVSTRPQVPSHPPTAALQASTTPLPTATVRSSTLPIREVTKNCADWVEWDFSRLSLKDVLFFVDFSPANEKKTFSTLSPDTGIMEPLPDLPGFLTPFGPPGNPKRFTYIDDQMRVILVNANGGIEAASPFQRHWHSALIWLDDQNLLVSYDPVSTSERNVEVFNPITNETQILNSERSDGYTFQVEHAGHFVWKQMYDPTLTRLTYTRETDSHDAVITMIDVGNGEILWEMKRASTGLDYPPIWSKDGSRMAVIANGDREFNYKNFEIFLVDSEGAGTQWVDLRETPEITAEDYQWSPDGRYLAIYGTSVFILDTKEQRLVDYCIPLSETGYFFGPAVPIIWSPNSQQVIFQREALPAVMLDLSKNTITTLTDNPNLLPVSWLATVP